MASVHIAYAMVTVTVTFVRCVKTAERTAGFVYGTEGLPSASLLQVGFGPPKGYRPIPLPITLHHTLDLVICFFFN